jgi:hypothetical protein
MAIKNINTDLTVNGEAQIGATSYQGDMNGGKADFSVDCGGTPEISFIGNYLQAGSTDQNWAMRLYTGVLHTYNQDLYITAGGTGTTNKLRLGTNGQTSTIVCDDGGVGIGTASPSYKLDVNGTLGSTQLHIQGGYALGSSANFLYIDPNTQFSSGIYINNAVKVDGGLLGSYNEDLQLRTGNDTRLTLSSSTGHVGIGTISPSTRLHISVPSSNSQLTLERTGSATGKYQIYTNTNNLYINNVASNTFPLTILNSGNVGIGTTSPASQLHLYGASGATGEIRLESSNGKAFTIGSTGTSYGSANNLIIYDINASTERLRIDTNGNVGIGVTNPSRELVVAGNVGLSGSNTYIFGGDNEILAGQDGSGYYFATGNGQNLTKPVFIGDNNSYIRFQSGDAERMRITSSGEVGIGTSNPETNLHIWASESGQTATNVSGLFIENAGSSNGYYVFQTATSVGKSFSITNAGNVGIGIGPSYPLEVANTATVSIAYQRTGVSAKKWGFHSDNSNTYWQNLTDNVLALTVSNAGNVGIGTTSPTAQLESIAPDGNKSSLRLGRSDTSIIWDFNHAGGDLRIWNSAASGSDILLGVDSGGTVKNNNVGIGTASPVAKLQVKGADSLNAFKVTDAGDGDGFKITSHTTQGTYVQVYDASHTQTINLDARSDNTNRHTYFNGGGNVGIGTTSPTHKLDVRGDIVLKGGSTQHSVIRFKRSDSAYDFAYIGFEDPTAANDEFLISSTGNGNPIKIQAGVGDTIHFYGDTTAYGGFDGNGNFGIGTTSPSSKLHVAGQIMISPSSGTPSLKFQDSGTTNAYIDLTDGQQRFDFRDDSDTVMSVTLNTLRVGIGTTSPDEVLEVKGIIKSENTGYTNTGIIINQTSHSDAWRLMQFGGGAFSLNLNGYTGGESRFSVSTSGDVSIPAGTLTVSGTGNSSIAGNVGIGTTSPATRLYVKETGAANTAIFENSGQAYSFAAIKVAESQNNKAVLSFAVGDALASTDIFGEINGIVTNNGGALTGDLYFKNKPRGQYARKNAYSC